MVRERAGSLFWRVCLTNGVVFLLGTLALVLSPVTVSEQPLWSEVVVLAVGLVVIFVLNALLLRSVLRPMDRLTSVMSSIDPRNPGQRQARRRRPDNLSLPACDSTLKTTMANPSVRAR